MSIGAVIIEVLRRALLLSQSSDYRPNQNRYISGNGRASLADSDAEFDSLVTVLRQASASVIYRHPPSAKVMSLTRQAQLQRRQLKDQMAKLLMRKEKLTDQIQVLQRGQNELEKNEHELAGRMLGLSKRLFPQK